MKRLVSCLLMVYSAVFASSNLAVLQATQENFSQITESKKPVIIDVNASWCGACKMIAPVFDDLSQKYKDKILFAKIDVDSQSALADQYNVTGLPTILFLKPGQTTPVMTSVGYMDKKEFEEKIKQFLKN
jgi:thioredoxin 1